MLINQRHLGKDALTYIHPVIKVFCACKHKLCKGEVSGIDIDLTGFQARKASLYAVGEDLYRCKLIGAYQALEAYESAQ